MDANRIYERYVSNGLWYTMDPDRVIEMLENLKEWTINDRHKKNIEDTLSKVKLYKSLPVWEQKLMREKFHQKFIEYKGFK